MQVFEHNLNNKKQGCNESYLSLALFKCKRKVRATQSIILSNGQAGILISLTESATENNRRLLCICIM